MDMKMRLTALQALKLKAPGRHAAGANLYLFIRKTPKGTLSRTWTFKYEKDGRVHELGLGSIVRVSFARARIKAAKLRLTLDEGNDPFPQKAAARPATVTFKARAKAYIEANGAGWNASHRHQWHKTVDDYLAPIANMPISAVDTPAVEQCLTPLWQRIPATALKVRGKLEMVLASATALGLRSGPNPAVWRGHLANILPGRDKGELEHHPAMAYADVPDFIRTLRAQDTMAARALEFTILTACRSGEVRGAVWTEFDLAGKIWTIPAGRMKGKREHRVPLSGRAMEILESLVAHRIGDAVFAGIKANTSIGKTAMPDLVPPGASVQGFRSAFRDWSGNETRFPREIAEQALAHRVGNGVEQAYRRSDALERRRELMCAWARFCEPGLAENVVPMRGAL
jgi:integrase